MSGAKRIASYLVIYLPIDGKMRTYLKANTLLMYF